MLCARRRCSSCSAAARRTALNALAGRNRPGGWACCVGVQVMRCVRAAWPRLDHAATTGCQRRLVCSARHRMHSGSRLQGLAWLCTTRGCAAVPPCCVQANTAGVLLPRWRGGWLPRQVATPAQVGVCVFVCVWGGGGPGSAPLPVHALNLGRAGGDAVTA
jgi:hypothetical protein